MNLAHVWSIIGPMSRTEPASHFIHTIYYLLNLGKCVHCVQSVQTVK